MLTAAATWVGLIVLAALALVAIIAIAASGTMLVMMAITRNARTGAVPRKHFRASADVWQVRWAHFLRHLLRSHGKVGGERERIERIGIGAFLWADDVRREPIGDPR